jgi:hypothetical protein
LDLIKSIQEDIAAKMRGSVPGKNYVMQLNMGEGKSSVIISIIAASSPMSINLCE